MATQLHDEQSYVHVDDMDEETAAWWSGCGCMQGVFCFRWCIENSNGCSRAHLLGRRQGEGGEAVVGKEKWWVKKAKKVKEVSEELVAGPKWKNFIGSINNKKRRTQQQFHPQSYVLNFDDGLHIQTQLDSANNYLRFSSAAPALGINNQP